MMPRRPATVATRFIALLVAVLLQWPSAGLMAAAAEADAGSPTALVTGANRGIGLEFVTRLLSRGWRVIATARNPSAANALDALAAGNPALSIEQLDVTRPEQIAALAERYTGQAIDLLLLNAAKGPVQPTATAPLKRQNFDVAAEYFATNAVGPMRVAQAFMPNVRASQRKLVVAISSDSGSFVAGSQLPILYHYKASKAALNMYFHTLSYETRRRGVTAVLLHPGMVATNPQTARLPGAMPTADSVRQMLTVIDGLSSDDNGRFVDYRGESMPW